MPRMIIAILAALVLAPLTARPQPATFAPIVKSQRDKVVHITTLSGGREEGGSEQRRPFRIPGDRRGLGSGFIISTDGYIVTNHHVIDGAGGIEVVLSDERKFIATIVGSDPQTDLALIKIASKDLPVAEFGDSSRLEVGDWVIAIGNPLGLDHTVTAGIISAKGRNIFDDENLAYGEFLQTDAAINPGNSGGPLFNLEGKVVGVNAAVSRRGQGIGFAVPSNLAMEVVRQLRLYGLVRRGWLGVSILELNTAQVGELSLPPGTRGIVIQGLSPDSPAQAGGLEVGDVLTRYGQENLVRVSQLQKLVAFTEPGAKIQVRGLRRNGGNWVAFTRSIRIGRNPRTVDLSEPSLLARLGIEAVDLSPGERKKMRLGKDSGVLVKSVRPGGIGEDIGLRGGDIVLEAARVDVSSRSTLEDALKNAASSRISILVRRGRKIIYLVVNRSDFQR